MTDFDHVRWETRRTKACKSRINPEDRMKCTVDEIRKHFGIDAEWILAS
jgi:hypothetical protein